MGVGNDSLYSDVSDGAVVDMGAGNDFAIGDYYDSTLELGNGNDYADVYSYYGLNTIDGGAGNDTIVAYGNSINGGAGNDYISCWGQGTVIGGTGNDVISIHSAISEYFAIQYSNGDGNDIVYNFSSCDTLKITDAAYSTIKSGDDLIVKVGDGSITLKGVADIDFDIDIVGTEETPIWKISGTTATYRDSAKILAKLTGLQSGVKASDLKFKNNVVTIGKNAIGTGKITAKGDGYKFVLASAGNLTYAGSNATLQGSTSTDTLIGSKKADVIYGGKGNDSVVGNAGNDFLGGGKGNDTLIGDKGNDTLSGGSGSNTLTGGKGNDVFVYTSGNDTITDYSTGDKIKITSGTVSSYVLNGNDGVLKIGNKKITLKNIGNDAVTVIGANSKITKYSSGLKFNKTTPTKATAVTVTSGYSQNSFSATSYSALVTVTAANFGKSIKLTGNAKNNKLFGSKKADTIFGGAGNDSIVGNAGNDKLFGDAGKDTLVGGKGDDTLKGGDGKDIFVYAKGDGKDFITDYAADDTIKITKGTISKTTVSGKNVIFTIGSGSITVKNGKGKQISITDATGKTTTKTYSKTMSSYDLIADNDYSTSQLDSILQVQSLGEVEFSDNKTLNDSLQSILAYSEK